MTRDEVLKKLADSRDQLHAMGLSSVSVFGSVARNEAGPESDVDLLVAFSKPIGLFAFVRTQNALSDLLGRPVDLVTADALREEFRAQIEAEALRAA